MEMAAGGFSEQMDAAGLGRINGAYRRHRIQEEARRIGSLPPLPQGLFKVVVLDPAWDFAPRLGCREKGRLRACESNG